MCSYMLSTCHVSRDPTRNQPGWRLGQLKVQNGTKKEKKTTHHQPGKFLPFFTHVRGNFVADLPFFGPSVGQRSGQISWPRNPVAPSTRA